MIPNPLQELKLRIMPTYKLYYFNLKARAEPIRWIFAQAGVKYEDIRLDKEQWAKMKPDTPNGSLPVLDVDGQMLAGSIPISRYVAEQHGLAGANEIENAQIAGIDDLLTDIANRFARFWFEKDEAAKAEMKKDLEEKHLPNYLSFLEKSITTNAAPECWVFGKHVTYVDLRLTLSLEFVQMAMGNDKFLESYPGISKLRQSVLALPNIDKWIKERPQTNF